MSSHPELTETKDGVVLRVHVLPGGGSTEIVGRHNEALKIKVAAPPTGGRANKAVLAVLADELGLASADLVMVSGETHRNKRVRLGDLDLETAAGHIDRMLELKLPGKR